jgi:hypothetical protein
MNEQNLNNLLDFLLEFQDQYSTGEPSVFINGNFATLIYQCNELKAYQMYSEVLNSVDLRKRLNKLPIGRLIYLYHSEHTLTIEAEITV